MLFCFRVMNACVLALLGALIASPLWLRDSAVERQLAHFLPPADATASYHPALAAFDRDAVLAKLRGLRIQIRGDLCQRGASDFLRIRICEWRAGT